jgi:hypothetical protein
MWSIRLTETHTSCRWATSSLNFGAIEFYSYAWIAELARDDTLLDLALDMPLGRRVDLVVLLANRERMPKRLKAEVRKLWEQVKKIAETRNTVAHSPIVFVWKGRPAEGPADVVGIPRVKDLKQKPGRSMRTTPIEQVIKAGGDLVPLAQGLETLLGELRAKIDKRRQRERGGG